MCAYVPMLYALLLWQGMPLCHPSVEPDPLPLLLDLLPQRVEPPIQHSDVNPSPLPQLSALPLAVHTPLQRGMTPLQSLSVRAPLLLSVSLQGLGVPHLLSSAMRAYFPLIW